MQCCVDWRTMLNLSRTATESADYSFSGIVIERDPTNHELPRGQPQEDAAQDFDIVPEAGG
jgi:hypothetical protein